MTTSMTLAPKLDLRAASQLRDELMANTGADLVLDAAQVNHFGALSLQVIRAAAKSWSTAGHKITLTNVSADIADQLSLLGFTEESATQWEQAQ